MLLPPYCKVNASVGGQMVTMATELFMGIPVTADMLRGNIYVLKESMNMQKGNCSGIFY